MNNGVKDSKRTKWNKTIWTNNTDRESDQVGGLWWSLAKFLAWMAQRL